MTTELTIRTALPHEIDMIIDIDDDSAQLYATAGVILGLTPQHPFVLGERQRWTTAAQAGRALLAERDGHDIGMAVLGFVDDAPYLDRISVRLGAMKQGAGRALLARALKWAAEQGGAELYLNTYGHLAWNRPFYERAGFVAVAEDRWGPQMRAIVAFQRASLPAPEHRVVMVSPAGP